MAQGVTAKATELGVGYFHRPTVRNLKFVTNFV